MKNSLQRGVLSPWPLGYEPSFLTTGPWLLVCVVKFMYRKSANTPDWTCSRRSPDAATSTRSSCCSGNTSFPSRLSSRRRTNRQAGTCWSSGQISQRREIQHLTLNPLESSGKGEFRFCLQLNSSFVKIKLNSMIEKSQTTKIHFYVQS